MDLIALLGIIGTFIDITRALPQLVRLVRGRKAYGVSVDAVGTSCVVSTGWTIYGIITHQLYVALASGIIATSFLLITLLALRLGRSVREFKIAPIWLLVLVGSGLFGKFGLGIILSISALMSNVPQIRVAYKEGDLSGLSLGTWLISLAGGLVWGAYAILQHDVTIMISATLHTITSATIIAIKLFKPAFKIDLNPEYPLDQ